MCSLCREFTSPDFHQIITINKEIKIQQGHTSKSQTEPDMMAHILPIPGLDPLLWLRSPLHGQRLLCAGSTLGSRVREKCMTTWLPFRWETGIPQRGNRPSSLSYQEILGNSRKFLWLLPALLFYLSGELYLIRIAGGCLGYSLWETIYTLEICSQAGVA